MHWQDTYSMKKLDLLEEAQFTGSYRPSLRGESQVPGAARVTHGLEVLFASEVGRSAISLGATGKLCKSNIHLNLQSKNYKSPNLQPMYLAKEVPLPLQVFFNTCSMHVNERVSQFPGRRRLEDPDHRQLNLTPTSESP